MYRKNTGWSVMQNVWPFVRQKTINETDYFDNRLVINPSVS